MLLPFLAQGVEHDVVRQADLKEYEEERHPFHEEGLACLFGQKVSD